MSTILKALRRLEEDSPPGSSNTASSIDAAATTDPHATDELRGRILAEESVAQAADAAAKHDSDRQRRRVMRGAAAALSTLALVVAAYTISSTLIDSDPLPEPTAAATPERPATPGPEAHRSDDRFAAVVSPRTTTDRATDSPILAAAPLPAASAAASNPPPAVSRPTPNESLASPASAQPTGPPPRRRTPLAPHQPSSPSHPLDPATPDKTADEMALAAAPPAPAATGFADSPRTLATPVRPLAKAPAEPSPPLRRPPPTLAAKAPPSVSARQPRLPRSPTRSATTSPTTASPRPAAAPKAAGSQPSQQARSSRESPPSSGSTAVERLDRPGLPDLTIIRTAWHPSADRRSAKIRLEASNEILNLREGDAVGGLVVQEISPSAVLFKAGDVEIRRRVGHPGSGG